MTSKRVPLALVLSAVLFVTAGFAATKKSHRNVGSNAWNDLSLPNGGLSSNWNDLSLQNGSLPDAGISVPSGVGNLTLSQGAGPGSPVMLNPGTPDYWNGGTGNWSVPGNWTGGEPDAGSDVTIYSGGADLVTLDVGSTTIASLTLGGAANGFTSELTDSGSTQTLSITNGLTIGASGQLVLTGGSTITAGADSSNAGLVDLENGSSLGITGNLTNSGTIQIGVPAGGGSTLNVSGDLSNAGFVDLENGSSLTVMGNFTNTAGGAGSGVYTSFSGSAGNNLLTINGTLDNQAGATFQLLGLGDTANVAMFTNEGNTYVAFGATLNLTNQPLGITDAVAGSDFELYGTFTAGVNPGFANLNSVEGTVNLYGQTLSINPGSGTLTIAGGGALGAIFNPTNSTGTNLTINGSVDNSGLLATGGGGNTLTITGDLTNEVGGSVNIYGGDKVNIGGNVTNDYIFQIITGPATVTINGSLANNGGLGVVNVESGSTLIIKGDVANSSGGLGFLAGFYTDLLNGVGGNTVNIGGSLTNSGIFQLNGPGDLASVGNGMNNSGTVNVDGGSTLNITGDVTNSGTIQTDPGGNTITINGTLSNSGSFELLGAGDMATLGGLVNSGTVDVSNGSTLTINGDVTNSGVITTNNSGLGGGNSLNVTGTLTNEVNGLVALHGPGDMATLGSLVNSGVVDVGNSSTLQVNGGVTNQDIAQFIVDGGSTATMGSLDNSAFIDVKSGSTLQVNGDATNSGNIVTDFNGTGGAMVNITGMLTNQGSGQFALLGPGDMATLGSLDNSGLVNVESDHSTLQVNGDVTNSGGIYSSLNGSGGNTINITGMLTNSGTFEVGGPGDMGTIGNGVTNNAGGLVDVENGSTLTIAGDVNNSGSLSTNQFGTGGGNNLAITGTLTNQAGGQFTLNGSGDTATVFNLDNAGFVDVEGGSTLQINNEANNSGSLYTGLNGTAGNKLSITSILTNSGDFELLGAGDTAKVGGNVTNLGTMVLGGAGTMATFGDLENSGFVDVEGGSTLQINADANNSGNFFTSLHGTGGNTVNITATLLNEAGAQFILYGPDDMATLGQALNNSGLVDIENHSTLQVNGNASNGGTTATDFNGLGGGNTLNITGNLDNEGTFQLNGSGDVATVGGAFSNSGNVVVGTGATLNVNSLPDGITDVVANSSFDLAGTFNVGANNGFYKLTSVEGGLILENGQTIDDTPNGGTLTVGSTGTVHVLNGTTFNINGNLQVDAGGVFSINDPNPTTVNISGTIMNLGGTINVLGPLAVLNAGTLGNSGMLTLPAGSTINLGHSFYQLAGGTLGESISSIGFAVINVNGSALLDGTLAILLEGGFNPSVGSTYKFLNFTPGMLSGIFANIENDIFNGGTEKWMVDYQNGDGFVELIAEPNGSPVPEPATLLVLIPGLLGAGYGLRRKLCRP